MSGEASDPRTSSLRTLSVAGYSRTPGARYVEDGPFSGEDFRRKVLVDAYRAARAAGQRLEVNLDGTAGYATSFLEEAFGGLAREYPIDEVLETIRIVSREQPRLVAVVESYIREARD